MAVDPDLDDPTEVVVGLFAALAPRLLEAGAVRHLITHVNLAPIGEALSNLGFGRGSVFAIQPAGPADPMPDVDIRIGTAADLDAIAALSHVELSHRSTAPIYTPPLPNTPTDTRNRHARLLDAGAVHFLASIDGDDVGLLTVEWTSPVPRLCPNGQPYIGPTATHPSARGRGVGHALVHAALDWAHSHGYDTVSVDFDSPNPLSRPFWMGLGFQPTGYGVRRTIDASFAGHLEGD
jgi:GNAT superfamily N-acetyltransferase